MAQTPEPPPPPADGPLLSDYLLPRLLDRLKTSLGVTCAACMRWIPADAAGWEVIIRDNDFELVHSDCFTADTSAWELVWTPPTHACRQPSTDR